MLMLPTYSATGFFETKAVKADSLPNVFSGIVQRRDSVLLLEKKYCSTEVIMLSNRIN